ncbi:NAD(P)/FAD-dependent oxidoreductase [Pelagibacteraceae bacterium]|jgi:predicted Rossmann fold flavoprotein|nr:NAD(P)/FAD-dependent oxidoreductase [Candidatus Pelagibacter sp.]MDB2363299.1 NAD(P)/FAD-dependent oxidoreductase [Candidatus Pelagibacter bacterium]MDC1330241.1 NAD(P)/FAD-dependent oxidoreductase [Pelagibacteraceae bacterium]MDA9172215.1 NAD(P)/FAD-dependent oxidoreductase [Candidatus Pelagibacter sp.]MDB3938513.1 NAD(P)/FAD-dependent oxidoreductase [Candidatus Pelagibacter sp.]
MSIQYDVIIVGAGAAGMMSAIEAGKRGRKVLLVDHYKKIGEKIRISGGGRCNFTNINTNPNKFLSQNPKFVRSALSQYTQNDFINLINKHEIKFHEKKLGQLFCDHSAQQIVEMLLKECELANVTVLKEFIIKSVEKDNDQYLVSTETEKYSSESLIVATGGLSVPKIGATSFGYEIAKKFDHNIIETLPALVPLTFNEKILEICKELTGLSVEAIVSFNKVLFQEGMLFTHRGLSGPSILQISSYWKQGDNIKVNLSPKLNVYQLLEEKRKLNPKFDILNIVSEILPKRLAQIICNENNVSGNISELSNKILKQLSENINSWLINPTGSEGYRTAEVTLGGVDTKELSSKTMMSNKHNNLFFIGEVMDVTGHLGGYNFQWAWSSGYVAGQYA